MSWKVDQDLLGFAIDLFFFGNFFFFINSSSFFGFPGIFFGFQLGDSSLGPFDVGFGLFFLLVFKSRKGFLQDVYKRQP